MAVQQTKAAAALQESSEITSHQVISLLMAGALERLAQARALIREKNEEDKKIVIDKFVAIVNGLRNSLDMDNGGDIANNLDLLYEYIIGRIDAADDDSMQDEALKEAERLISEVKAGWDDIDLECKAMSA